MPDALDDLLKDEPPGEQAAILRELVERHQDPRDPIFELMRIFKLLLNLNEQTIAVSEHIPQQLHGLLAEIDENFMDRSAEWRSIPPQVTQAVRDAVAGILPELEEKARAAAIGQARVEIAAELDSARTQFTRISASLLTKTIETVQKQHDAVADHSPEQHRMQALISSGIASVALVVLGSIGGCAWGVHHAPVKTIVEPVRAHQNAPIHKGRL